MMLSENNPYGKNVKGSLDTIKTATAAHLRSYFNKHYAQCMVYVSCRKSLHSEVKKVVKHKFGDKLQTWNFDDICTFPKDSPELFADLPLVKVINQQQRSQNATILMFRGMSYANEMNTHMEFIWDILTGSLNSLLMMEIREKRGLVYGITAFNDGYACVGVTGIYFTSSSEKTHETIMYIKKVLDKLKLTGLSDEVLKYCKTSYINKLKYKLTNPEFSLDRKMMRNYYNSTQTEEDILRKLKKVTNEMIKETSRCVFDFEKCCVVTVGKYQNEDRTTKNIQRVLSGK
jgi:predicted Zn-dependent peptidase